MDEIFGMPIINDDNAPEAVDVTIGGELKTRGYLERDWSVEPFGRTLRGADDEKLIDPSEYDAWYDEGEANRSTLKHVNEHFKLPPKDQNGTSNCWANAPVAMTELKFLEMGLDSVDLSPGYIASVCGEFNGGMGIWAMKVMQDRGVPETKLWGANKNSTRGIDDSAVLANAARFKVAEFRDLPSRDMKVVFHHLFLNRPICVGLNWWGHEVYYLAPIRIERGRWGVVAKNSWGPGYGKNGVFVLEGGKMVPDDAQVLYRVIPYGKAA